MLDVIPVLETGYMVFLSSAFCPNFLDPMLLKIEATISHVSTTLNVRKP